MKLPKGHHVELLDQHDRNAFTCGKDPLDAYLKNQAGQDQKRHLARCYVLVKDSEPQRILAYYTLSTLSITREAFPMKTGPYSEVPCLLLGRLARDLSVKGQGLGEALFFHILADVSRIADEVGVLALVVDALDEQAKTYYLERDFVLLEDMRLFLTIKNLRVTLKALE